MSTTYNAVGGIGVQIILDMLEEPISSGEFTEEEWDDDPTDCIEELVDDKYSCIKTDDDEIYLLIDGSTLPEVNSNVKTFINYLGNRGIKITEDDLKVISELYSY